MDLKGEDIEGDRPLSEYQIFYERPKRVGSKKSYREFASDGENSSSEVGSITDDYKRRKIRVSRKKDSPSHIALEKKQKQMLETLRWLGDNYELKEGMCLPRCVMYTHYLDFSKKKKLCPSGPATFGKIIRQKFPKLTTRRLGTRGQSKYHYYGIQVSESSPYFHSGYSKQGLTRFSTMKAKVEGQANNKKFPLGNKTRTLLPEFPDANKLSLPSGVSIQKVETFIMMYRTHCQRLLDTVISANFDGVQNFLLHFWQGMPPHMKSVLHCPAVVHVIAICDSILYKVLIDVLIPTSIQDLPESLRDEIREFAVNLLEWLEESLSEAPSAVKEAKFKVARTFGNVLTRQVSFVHLAQTARSVLLSYDSVSGMIADLRQMDFRGILTKVTFITDNMEFPPKTKTYVQEFENLLSKQAPLEAYTEWLDSVVDRCILTKCGEESGVTFEEKAAEFMGMWTLFTSKILEDLTLRSAPSFGVFHLIQTTFQEYVLLIMENQKLLEMDKKLHRSLQGHTKRAFQGEDYEVPSATFISSESIEMSSKDDNKSTPCDDRAPATKQNQDNNNNNNKVKTKGYKTDDARLLVKTASSDKLGNLRAPASIPRKVPTIPVNINTGISQRQVFAQHQEQPLINTPTNERYQLRGMPQYNFPVDEVTSHTAEMTSYHSDFINSLEKNMFTSNVSVGAPEFMTNPWIQNDGQSLTVLNTVNYDPTGPIPGNSELEFHRTAEFGMGLGYGEANMAANGIHPMEIPNSLNHRVDFAYNHPRKEDYASFPNAYTRYNNLYFDSMRGAGQGVHHGNHDVMSYTGFAQQPASAMELQNMVSGHDVQMSRLGVGTV